MFLGNVDSVAPVKPVKMIAKAGPGARASLAAGDWTVAAHQMRWKTRPVVDRVRQCTVGGDGVPGDIRLHTML